mgnify:CR=1 FL=1|jgi:predicted transcriptional regulator
MGFKKGNSLGGRKVGSTNKCTKEIREIFKEILLNDIDKIRGDIEAIDKPELRVKMRLEIAKLVLPTLKPVVARLESNIEDAIPFTIRSISLSNEDE